MVSALANLWISLIAGIFAPLGALCVLPLYPGFLAYLANQLSGREAKKSILILLGLTVTAGIIISMMVFGLIFTTIFKSSLTNAIGIISPVAFLILGIISILMIFNVNIGRFFPKIHAPITKKPLLSSFIFGLFFGAIILPCNPASLVVLFALSTTTLSFVLNFFNFLLFGIGMALPLLLFVIISHANSKKVIGSLTKYKRTINVIAGIIMLGISIYYLLFVFRIGDIL